MVKSNPSDKIGLSCKALRAGYPGSFSLKIDQLELEGKVIALIGHNGSGKSTFMKTILGLLEPSQGSLKIEQKDGFGNCLNLIPEKHMSFSPENGSVFADISVESYIKLWCRIKQGNPNYYSQGGSEYIEALGVKPLLAKLGRNLSKGERRRVQTAVGFMCNPSLFLFDEPFDGLDVQQANQLAEIMKDATAKMGLIISSHQMNVVERLADQIIVLKEGCVFTNGTVEEVSSELGAASLSVWFHLESEAFQLCLFARSGLSDCLVHQQGRRVVFTGRNVSEEILSSICNEQGYRDFSIEKSQPSLVDAMGYHLMHLES